MKSFPITALAFLGLAQFLCVGSSPCEDCPYRNGVYKAKHETHCCMYYDCEKVGEGWNAIERECSDGLFWDNATLTCNYPNAANCAEDSCRTLPNDTKVADECACYGYFTCQNGVSSNWHVCPDNEEFINGTCVPDTDGSCKRITTTTVQYCPDPNMQPHPTDNTKYLQIVHGITYEMPCPPGTVFNPSICVCGHSSTPVPCTPETDIDFSSELSVFENVTLENMGGLDVGCFNGIDSKIILPAYTNMGNIHTIIIEVKFKETFPDESGNYVLFTNCDCNETSDGSIRSSLYRHNTVHIDINAHVDTTAGSETVLNHVPGAAGAWKTHIYRFVNNGPLENKVDVPPNTAFGMKTGLIKNRHSALQFGFDGCNSDMKPFLGCLDQITIYRCVP